MEGSLCDGSGGVTLGSCVNIKDGGTGTLVLGLGAGGDRFGDGVCPGDGLLETVGESGGEVYGEGARKTAPFGICGDFGRLLILFLTFLFGDLGTYALESKNLLALTSI